MKFTAGKGAGLVGGILTIVGLLLPWATISGGSLTAPVTFMGLFIGAGAWLVFIFGLLGLIFVLIEKRVFAILTLVFGILALLMTLLSWLGIAAIAIAGGIVGVTVTVDYGVYLTLVGTIILIIGGALAMGETKKMMMAPPMMPPPMQAPPPGM